MLGTLLIVWGFGTLFGSIALGKWEEHCSKPKILTEDTPVPVKITWKVALAILIISIVCTCILFP